MHVAGYGSTTHSDGHFTDKLSSRDRVGPNAVGHPRLGSLQLTGPLNITGRNTVAFYFHSFSQRKKSMNIKMTKDADSTSQRDLILRAFELANPFGLMKLEQVRLWGWWSLQSQVTRFPWPQVF